MKDMLGSIVGNKLIMAIVGIVFGAVLVVMQKEAIDGLVSILGAILLVSAAVFVVLYALGRDKRPSYIASAIVAGVAGFVFVALPGVIVDFFPMLMGIVLIVSGIIDLAQVIAVLRHEGRSWGTAFFMSVVVIALGVFMLFYPGAIVDFMVLIIGISLLVNGLFDLYLQLVTRNIIHQRNRTRAQKTRAERAEREQAQAQAQLVDGSAQAAGPDDQAIATAGQDGDSYPDAPNAYRGI